MSESLKQAVRNILDGECVDTQVDDLLEYRAVLKRIGAFAGLGAGGGALANYIHARGRGLRGRQALRAAGRGAAYGAIGGAGLGGYTEYHRSLATRAGKEAESRFRKFSKETIADIERRMTANDPVTRLGKAAASAPSRLASRVSKVFRRGK